MEQHPPPGACGVSSASPCPSPWETPSLGPYAAMCYQMMEIYASCRCLYYQYAVDRCAAYGRPGHGIQRRTILVGDACPEHSQPRPDSLQNGSEPEDGAVPDAVSSTAGGSTSIPGASSSDTTSVATEEALNSGPGPSDPSQKPRRARTSKPKTKTGCNNCKWVHIWNTCPPQELPLICSTPSLSPKDSEESDVTRQGQRAPIAFGPRRSARVIRRPCGKQGHLRKSG